jgi:hypothetical protein
VQKCIEEKKDIETIMIARSRIKDTTGGTKDSF